VSIHEVPGRPSVYDVIVYDRVTVPGQRPAKVKKRVKGQRAAEKVERALKRESARGALRDRSQPFPSTPITTWTRAGLR
jgi:hypothetical protein